MISKPQGGMTGAVAMMGSRGVIEPIIVEMMGTACRCVSDGVRPMRERGWRATISYSFRHLVKEEVKRIPVRRLQNRNWPDLQADAQGCLRDYA